MTAIDPRIPPAEKCVLRNLLDGYAETQPDKIFARFQDGREWSFAQTRGCARRVSGALYELGLRQRESVFCWLPNGSDFLEVWFGTNYMGGLFVPANIAYRGGILAHALNVARAKIGVIHADLLPRLAEIAVPHLEKVIVIGGPAVGSYPGIELIDGAILQEDWVPAPLEDQIQPWDPIYVIYTSGTTGPSKGVLSSFVHAYSGFEGHPHLSGPDNRFMVFLPMFHLGGCGPVYTQLTRGGSVAIIEGFRTQDFWRLVRETGSTTCLLLGVMAPFLIKAPPSPDDRRHGLKAVLITPLGEDAVSFGERFGVDMSAGYGMTELSGPVASGINPPKLNTAGRLREGFEARLVDENDNEVPVGEVGEIIVRSDRPWGNLTEYYGNPEATAKAWRNGWFHTGDLLRKDEEGWYYFADRKKDAIRRRGENISSYEVEVECMKHASIREVAAYAVKSDISEDEVMIAVSLVAGAGMAHAEFIEFLVTRMPHYAVPRYVRLLEELPKTPTGKVQKETLRGQGVTHDTWDREIQGIIIKRQKIGA